MKTFVLVAFLFCFSTYCYGQNKLEIRNSSIANIGYIQLRWAPVDFATFDFGRINGYQLIRTTIRQSDTILSGYQMYQSKVVLDSMILPLAEMDWESMADTNDIAGIAAMALYGEEVEVLSVDSVNFMEVANLNVSVRPTPSSPAFSGSVILPRTKYRKNESGTYKETRRMDGA
jgi:hypothetical protein